MVINILRAGACIASSGVTFLCFRGFCIIHVYYEIGLLPCDIKNRKKVGAGSKIVSGIVPALSR